MNTNQKFDVVYDEENKLRYYNCAPIKRNSLTPSTQFDVVYDEEQKLRYYNCAPVKRNSLPAIPATTLIPADEGKKMDLNKDEVFGVYCDDGNKIHYYNCAPIKQKKAGKKSPPQPIRKMFTRLFRQGDATPSGSDLSLSSTDSVPTSKS